MVCVFAVMDDGRTVALAAIGREGFLGVPAFLGAESAQLRAVAIIDGDALKLSQDELRRILPVSPQFAASLRRYSSGYLAQIGALGGCQALHSVHHRLAFWLLMAHDRANSHTLPLTHESLSELLGCRRSSVTEALSLLQNPASFIAREATSAFSTTADWPSRPANAMGHLRGARHPGELVAFLGIYLFFCTVPD